MAAPPLPPPQSGLSYESFLTIVLTALCAMLAILAIGVGFAAIWGYNGIKEMLTKSVRESADLALQEKLKEYPAAAEMVDFRKRLEEAEQVRSQITPEPNQVADAGELVQDGIEGEDLQSIAEDYPREVGS